MAERGITRKATYYYGARHRQDLCFETELHALEQTLPNFRFVPALSEPTSGDGWDGEVGLITDVVGGTRPTCGRRRLRLRATADGRGGDGGAQRAGRAREAHLLRQVHHHR